MSGFSESRKCVVPGIMHNCAPLIDLNSSSVCPTGIASLSPAITSVGELIFPSSCFVMLGSLSHRILRFLDHNREVTGTVRGDFIVASDERRSRFPEGLWCE